ncbi:MAG: monovalent cation/H+ antiporter subunit A [Enhydrobacter sp.]|nr:monovalent cation/H+ antiporter subunit A [Enhydrobacter sp.]
MSELILLPLVALFAAVPLLPVVARIGRRVVAWSAALVMATGLAALSPLMPDVLAGQTFVFRQPWLTEWGIDLSLRLDGLGLLFAILILGIGMLIVLYGAYYLSVADRLGRFYALLLAFAGGMLGVVLAENMLLMLLFWEITSLTSFLLIAYRQDDAGSRISARMALAVTGGGGLALLAGLLLLGHIAGSFELSDVLARGDIVRAHPYYPLVLVLVLLGAFTKSAQFPFHFWLPNAMAAPTPVSAYLHSATMVKAGVFLIARLYPCLSGTDLWFVLVSGTGAVTFIYGAYFALLKHDFKGLLAYSTVSHLGLITLLFGLNTPLSAVAGIFHIINHAIFKASLFMAAGIIDHECGTRDMRRINGMFKYMPYTAVLGILAAGSMAGVPLLNGFLSKEMFFAETIGNPAFAGYAGLTYLLPAFATLAGMLSVAYSLRFVHDVFFNGEPIDLPRTPHEPPHWMRLPVEILVALCLLVGLLPRFTVGPILTAAAGAVIPSGVPAYTLAIWHGFNLPLAMSVIALAGGALHYWRRQVLFAFHEKYHLEATSPVLFERAYREATRLSQRVMALVDTESLQRYMALLIGFVLLLGVWAYATAKPTAVSGPLGGIAPEPIAIGAVAALVLAVAGTVMYDNRQRVVAVIYMSVVGLIVSLAFVRFSAPDLALTQLSVEVVTIVLLLSSLRFLPAASPRDESRSRLTRDAMLAVLGGGGLAILTYAMLTRPFDTISGFYLANSVPGGGGSNVVNVILVDFRGFDTLGEITVLALAALGVHASLDGLRLQVHTDVAAREADRHPVMLAMLMRPLLPLALTVSVYILLRGHNLPGGGFIAGLITGVGLMLQYVARGIDFSAARLQRLDYIKVTATGLALAGGTGLASWLFGQPFLTSAHGYVYPPLIGKMELASAIVFDLGVYLVVVAGVLLVLSELGGLSRHERGTVAPARPG